MESLFFESCASICVNPPLFLLSASAFGSLWSIYKISFLMQLPIIPSWLYFQFSFDSPLGVCALSFPPLLRRDKIMNLFSLNDLSPVTFKWKTKDCLIYIAACGPAIKLIYCFRFVKWLTHVPRSSYWFLYPMFFIPCIPKWLVLYSSLLSCQRKLFMALKNNSAMSAEEKRLLKRCYEMVLSITCIVLQRCNYFHGSDPWPVFLLSFGEPPLILTVALSCEFQRPLTFT